MFTPDERTLLRLNLLEYAATDIRICSAAITGSAASEREDRWSDIDLAFSVAESAELPGVLSDWTAHMYDQRHAIHHLDVSSGAWTYRVFLLRSTLQVDVAFVPSSEFRALAPTFRLVFGQANEAQYVSAPNIDGIIGLAWLYALHARSSIARGKLWQAVYMINGVRDNGLALACTRHGLSAVHGRGLDKLPTQVTGRFEDSLVRRLDVPELSRAFQAALDGLVVEIGNTGANVAGLRETLLQLGR